AWRNYFDDDFVERIEDFHLFGKFQVAEVDRLIDFLEYGKINLDGIRNVSREAFDFGFQIYFHQLSTLGDGFRYSDESERYGHGELAIQPYFVKLDVHNLVRRCFTLDVSDDRVYRLLSAKIELNHVRVSSTGQAREFLF